MLLCLIYCYYMCDKISGIFCQHKNLMFKMESVICRPSHYCLKVTANSTNPDRPSSQMKVVREVLVNSCALRTFALIVSVYPYCEHKFTRHIMRQVQGRWPLLWLCLDLIILDVR